MSRINTQSVTLGNYEVNTPNTIFRFDNTTTKGLTHRTIYYNYTFNPITIIPRNNFKYVINRTTINDKNNIPEYIGKIVVRDILDIDYEIFPLIKEYLLNLINENIDESCSKLKDIFLSRITDTNIRNLQLIIDYVIQEKDLLDKTNIYLGIKDIVVSKLPILESPDHPYSFIQLQRDGLSNLSDKFYNDSNITNGLFLGIEIIDNNDVISKRYLSFGDEVLCIPTSKSIIKTDGVYLSILEPNSNIPKIIKNDLDTGCEKIGLHKNKEDAQICGRVELRRELELEQLKHDTAKIKIEHEREKQVYSESELALKIALQNNEKDKLKLEAEIQKMKMDYEQEKAKRDEEKSKRNDEYEKRSTERKESLEIVKFIPSLIAAGLAIIVIMNKNSKV